MLGVAVVAPAIEQPAWGQVRVTEALKRQGLSISPAGVRWRRMLRMVGMEQIEPFDHGNDVVAENVRTSDPRPSN